MIRDILRTGGDIQMYVNVYACQWDYPLLRPHSDIMPSLSQHVSQSEVY